VTRIHDISKGRKRRAGSSEPLVGEDIDARLAETAKLFVDAAWSGEDDEASPPSRRRSREEVEAEAFKAMRGFLGDELTIVSKLEGPDGIDPGERERQIARRALSRLTKLELQRAAVSVGLPKSGTKDDLLDRLMLHLGGDTRAVSSLLSSVDRHTREGRRHATRLVPFESLGGPESVWKAIAPYEGRYVRTDLASWFLLNRVSFEDASLVVDGHLRTYDVTLGADDLDPHERDLDVGLVLTGEDSVLRTHSKGEPEAIAAVEAFALLVGDLPLPALAKVARSQPVWGKAGRLRVQTIWMLGVLLGLLDNDDMTLEDVTSASFERSTGDRSGTIGSRVPHVGSAQLRGQHVLDSQSACRHVASGERLRAVTAIVRFVSDDGTSVRLPVRILVEPSYVAVMTGFGGLGREASRGFHARMEDYLAQEMLEPSFDPARLERVVDTMLDRASAVEPPEEADLFSRHRDAEIRLDA